MSDTQLSQNSVHPHNQQSERVTPVRGVWQDKIASRRYRVGTDQPVTLKNVTLSHVRDTKTARPQNTPKKHSTKRQLVPLMIWVSLDEKQEVQRIAQKEGLSLSSAGRAGIQAWIRQKLHIQHVVYIQPIIETTLRNELRRYFSRMILFLARITMTLDVIKGLVKWLCRRLAGASKEQVDNVEAVSRKDARLNLVKRTPQLESITEELEKTLMEGIT